MDKDLLDTLYLMGCALNSAKADPVRLKQMNFEKIYQIAAKHMISSIVVTALLNSGIFNTLPMPKDLSERWKAQQDQTIRQTMLMDYERSKILSFMESEGIRYMPLKGIILKELYPQFGMRQMSDNDIFFDKTRKDDLIKYMDKLNYQCWDFPTNHHLIFKKPPFYNFEMHTSLMNEKHDRRWEPYNREVPNHLIKDDNNKCGYHFSDEDFYLYMIIHSYKHYSSYGTGLRILADWYVFLSRNEKSMDWNYTKGELKKYNLIDYEENGRSLSKKIFGANGVVLGGEEPVLSTGEAEMLRYIYGSGVYGVLENKYRNELKNVSIEDSNHQTIVVKLKYYWKRVVPPVSWYEENQPFLYRNRIFIPFYVVGRLFHAVLFKKSSIKNEMNTIDEELKEEKKR